MTWRNLSAERHAECGMWDTSEPATTRAHHMGRRPMLSSKTSPVSILTAVAIYFGIGLFLLSFSLPAVGYLSGWQCAGFAIRYWAHDDQISSLALLGAGSIRRCSSCFFSPFSVLPRPFVQCSPSPFFSPFL